MSHVEVELYNSQKEIVSMSLNSLECPVSILAWQSAQKEMGKNSTIESDKTSGTDPDITSAWLNVQFHPPQLSVDFLALALKQLWKNNRLKKVISSTRSFFRLLRRRGKWWTLLVKLNLLSSLCQGLLPLIFFFMIFIIGAYSFFVYNVVTMSRNIFFLVIFCCAKAMVVLSCHILLGSPFFISFILVFVWYVIIVLNIFLSYFPCVDY